MDISHFRYAFSTNLCRFDSKAAFLKKIIFIPFLLLLFINAFGQPTATERYVNMDTVQNIATISSSCYLLVDSNEIIKPGNVLNYQFVPLHDIFNAKYLPSRLAPHTFYLKFTLKNDSSSIKNYFLYPGKVYRSFQLYKVVQGNQLQKLETSGLRTGFIPFTMEAAATTTYILQAKFYKTQFNDIQATIIAPHILKAFQSRMYETMTEKKVVGIVLSGMLLMMILMTFLNFFITQKVEFLYNSLYSLCMFLLIFFTSYLGLHPGWFKGLFISYLDMLLLMVGTIFYILFTRYFLESRSRYPRIDKLFRYEIIGLLLLLTGYTILHFGFNNFELELKYENAIKIIVLLAGIIYILLAMVQKNKLLNYLAIGVAIQVFCYIISLSLNLLNADTSLIFTSPFFYFELGVIFSVLFFLLGLFHKNRQELITNIKEQEALKTEAEKQQYENKLSIYQAQQEERNRISADMHDDLGAGMTSIRLYSELAKGKVGENVIPEIDRISSSADELLNKMNAIIWSMSSHNDSLGNMVGYIRSYATDYLESTGIEHNIIIPENLPAIEVNGTIRRNVFLVIKEALQNIIKHSGAKKVHIEMRKEREGLSLTIHDDGKGIDFNNIRPYSNGLTNMKKRMTDVEIDFTIENNNGTLITLYRKTL
jgi:signal transduction histidine kinase